MLTDAHLARAYGVEVVRGERDGVPYPVAVEAVPNVGRRPAVSDAAINLAFLADQIADHETNWSLGTFGAIAEFARDPDEPVALSDGDAGLTAVTARGGIRIDARGRVCDCSPPRPRRARAGTIGSRCVCRTISAP